MQISATVAPVAIINATVTAAYRRRCRSLRRRSCRQRSGHGSGAAVGAADASAAGGAGVGDGRGPGVTLRPGPPRYRRDAWLIEGRGGGSVVTEAFSSARSGIDNIKCRFARVPYRTHWDWILAQFPCCSASRD
ncbi:hypothetical protein JCM9534A_32620 [Catenuloplanes indicus JCM 9534]